MKNLIHQFCREEEGNALAEAAILFPVMFTMLMGIYDLGQGLIINQKTVTTSQVIGDLIARRDQTSMAEIDDIIVAGQMSMEPYDLTSFGYDIVSVFFDADGNPDIQWRVTDNMDPNDEAIEDAEILEMRNDGIVIVTSVFEYDPFFSDFVVDNIDFQEVAFLKGRLSSIVSCPDCPEG